MYSADILDGTCAVVLLFVVVLKKVIGTLPETIGTAPIVLPSALPVNGTFTMLGLKFIVGL